MKTPGLTLALSAIVVLFVAYTVATGGLLLPFVTVTSKQRPFYASHLVVGAARNGLMPVVIINNPFSDLNTDGVVAFDASTDASRQSNIRRVHFAAPCGSGALRLIAKFWNGSEPHPFASATAPRLRSVLDISFRRLMVSLSNAVFTIAEYGIQGR